MRVFSFLFSLLVAFCAVVDSDVPETSICPEGLVAQNGICMQRSSQCPTNYVLLNGLCYPIIAGFCSSGHLFINGNCCTVECINSCQIQAGVCKCCGSAVAQSSSSSAPGADCPNAPILPNQPYPIYPPPYMPYPIPPNNPSSPCPNLPLYPNFPCNTQPLLPVQPAATTTPRPAEIKRCPEGTVLINNICRLIYCSGGIYKNNKCIRVACPEGSFWTGIRCAPDQPTEHSIHYNHTTHTHFNRTEPHLTVNNVNSVVINTTINDSTDQTAATTPNPSASSTEACDELGGDDCLHQNSAVRCCEVFTPRVCRRRKVGDTQKWSCYSRRYKRCGDFCVAPVVYLRAERVQEAPEYGLVMPPDTAFADCRVEGSCVESENFYDCSGCATNLPATCSSYCYRYQCSARGGCQFYDHHAYCSQEAGAPGCRGWWDGCFEAWCENSGAH